MTELVAEVGLAHEGSLGLAHSYIDLAASIHLDTIKFQMHIADQESSHLENFRINFSYQDRNRFEYWDRTSFSIDEWAQLIKHAETKKLNFLISPFSIKAIDLINKLGLDRLKIGSAETIDDLFIEYALKYNFEYIISDGFSDEKILEIIKHFKNKQKKLTVLECTSKYPSLNRDFNNNRYEMLQKIKDIGFGVSDHTSETSILKYAISTQADIVEAHIVFDKRMFGPDSEASLEPSQWREIVKFRNDINEIKSKYFYKIDSNMKETFSRSITFNKNLRKNVVLNIDDFNSIKANGYGIPSIKYKQYIGKKLLIDVKKGDFLKDSDVQKDD